MARDAGELIDEITEYGTWAERRVRSLLHARGYRFRNDHRLEVPGARVRPDIVFTRQRVAAFVDGCFWHRCPEHGASLRATTAYWSAKLERNVTRDERVDRVLRAANWTELRLSEHLQPEEAVLRIAAILSRLSK
jgi:DNA mismatch endonuclease, patch repair protein